MKLKYILIIVFFICLSTSYGLEECHEIQYIDQIPCRIQTTYSLPLNCSTYQVYIYQENGSYISTSNLQSYGMTGLCQYQWNNTNKQCYTFNMSNGEYGSICVEVKDNMLSLILFQIFLIAFFILIGIPFKFGFLKFFSWGMALIEILVSIWLVYGSVVGGNIQPLLFANYMGVFIVGGFLGLLSMTVILIKLMNVDKSSLKDDAYTKWAFGK